MPGRRGPGAGALVREVPGDLSVWSEMTSATPAAFRPVPLILVAVAVVCGALACRMLGLGEGVLLVAAPASGMALAAALVLRWKGALAATAGFLLAGAIWGLAPGDLVADTLGHGLAALVGAQAMRMLARRRRIETKTREWLIFVAGVAAFTATIVAVLALAELAGALAVPPPPPLTPLLAAVFEPLGILTFCTVLGNFHEFRQIRADPRPTVGIAALAVVLLGLLWALLELPPEIVNRSGVTLLLSVPFCLWVAMQQRSLDGGVLSYLAALAALVIVRREVPSVLHPDFIATVVYLSLLVLVCQLVHAVNLDRLLALAEVEGHKRELEARVAERTEKLSAMTERALAADAAKTRFMATVSHEVRTPLNGVIGMASVVLAGDLDERTRRNVAMIRTSGFHLLDVINRILDFSKLEHSEAVDEITVFARVAPEHKIRLVAALQRKGNVVAMTGDGVNDAPALKKADMGVAMGITGTEVTKEAATMVLADDNFASIVRAVKRGRTIYDNIVKFVRFQLSTTLGFAALFLLAAIFGIANGKPFTAIAILWVNIIMDGPPAMALGLDKGGGDVMARAPRPLSERILTRSRWTAVAFAASVMALGTLAVLQLAPGAEAEAGVATVAGTMAFNTFVLFQFFNILNARSDRQSVFSRFTFSNRWLWLSLGAVLVLQVGVTHVGFMQDLFDTTSITLAQWLVCVAVASSVLWLEEARKFIVRRREATAQAKEA